MVLRVETVESDFDNRSKVGAQLMSRAATSLGSWERSGVSTVVLRLGTEPRPSPFDLNLGVLTGMDAELFHARKQGGAVDAHAGGSPVGATYPALALQECSHNLFPLLVDVFL